MRRFLDRQIRSAFALSLFLFALLMTGCEEDRPLISETIGRIPVPENVSIQVGTSEITIDWTFDATFAYSGFVVYRSDDNRQSYARVGVATAPPFTDTDVRFGSIYWYRVSGIDDNGIEGGPSTAVAAAADVYAMLIEGGAPATNRRDVTLAFTAPLSTRNVRFGVDSLLAGNPWRPFTVTAPFSLTAGDGSKKLYAQFLDVAGNTTREVSSSIILDTFAQISSKSFSCLQACLNPDTISPGATVHFSVTPVGGELDGFAQVFIEGRGEDPLFAIDEGTLGDAVAGDGVYEMDHVFPQFFRERSMRVSATFVDAVGNQSPELEFPNTLIMSDPPAAVLLFPSTDSTSTSVSLRWTRSDEVHFARYELYRDTTLPVSPARSLLAASVNQVNTTTFVDSVLATATEYYYQVFVVNDLGDRTGSVVRTGHTLVPAPSPPQGGNR